MVARNFNLYELLFPASLVLALASMVTLCGPWGPIPVNDDWSYSAASRFLAEHGRIAYTDWTSLPLLPQLLLGGAAAWVWGWSEDLMRVCTQVVAGLGLVAAYYAAKEAGASARGALVVALCMLVNPLFFNLTNSFMSDVYFLALIAATSWAWFRHAHTGSAASFWLGVAFAALATLQRQFGLGLPVAFGLALLLSQGISRSTLKRFALAVVVVFAVHIGYDRYVTHFIGRPSYYDGRSKDLIIALTHPGFGMLKMMLVRSVALLGYFGVALAPLLLAGVNLRGLVKRTAQALAAALVLLGALIAFMDPPFDSLIHSEGVGLVSMRGVGGPSAAFIWCWRAVIFVGCAITASWLASNAARLRVTSLRMPFEQAFCALTAAAFLAPVLPLQPLFDRYILPLLLLLSLALAPTLSAVRWRVAVPFVAAMGLWCVLSAQDSFALQRAKWAAVKTARERGAQAHEIEAGFEHDQRRLSLPSIGHQLTGDMPKVEPLRAHFVVAVAPGRGAKSVTQIPADSWLHPGRALALLELEETPASDDDELLVGASSP